MTGGDKNTFVPGINDLDPGNSNRGILSVSEKIERGKKARDLLNEFKDARQNNDTQKAEVFQECSATKNSLMIISGILVMHFLENLRMRFQTSNIILYFPPYGDARILLYPGFCSGSFFLYRGTLLRTEMVSLDCPCAQFCFLMWQENWDGYLRKWVVSHGLFRILCRSPQLSRRSAQDPL